MHLICVLVTGNNPGIWRFLSYQTFLQTKPKKGLMLSSNLLEGCVMLD